MSKKKFDLAFEAVMAGTIPENQSFFEKLIIDAILLQIKKYVGVEAKYIGNFTFEWEFANKIGCQIMISDNGQVFASAANSYPGDKEAFDSDDYQLYDNHSCFIHSLTDIIEYSEFSKLLEDMLQFNN
jgi:hypothetical protein